MVTPEWYFSTLSQGTAAIVGLLVSARLIQYQLERQRRERRTEDLREEIQEFEEKFGHLTPCVTGCFAQTADLSFLRHSHDFSMEGDELNLKIAEEASFPVVTMYWAHFSRISHVLMTGVGPSPDPEEHYLMPEAQFERLRESIEWLNNNLDERSDFIDVLYEDLGISGNNQYTKDVFDPNPPGESLQQWLQRYQEYASRHTTLLSGKNLQSFKRVTEELQRDFKRIDALRENTILTFKPGINPFLLKSGALVLVGVILPVASLISNLPAFLSPLVLDSTLLFLYEGVLLLATFSLIVAIFRDLQHQFGEKRYSTYIKEQIDEL